jgi:hypothetical protein
MIVSSGTPFNITVPTPPNGVSNLRPTFVSSATCPSPGTVTGTEFCTALGTFNTTIPTAGQEFVPINFGTGPAHETLNLRLTKTFGFGPKTKNAAPIADGGQRGGGGGGSGGGGGGGHTHGPMFGGGPGGMSAATDRRYNLTFGVSVRNVFNKVNLESPNGVLNSTANGTVSQFFDTPNALQGGPFSTGSAVRRIDLQATFTF